MFLASQPGSWGHLFLEVPGTLVSCSPDVNNLVDMTHDILLNIVFGIGFGTLKSRLSLEFTHLHKTVVICKYNHE